MTWLPGTADTMRRQVEDAYPAEGIGLLAGSWAHLTISRVAPLTNTATPGSRRSVVTAADAASVLADLTAAGLDFVGCFHSHPDGVAELSRLDLRAVRYAGVEVVAVVHRPGLAEIAAWLVAPGKRPRAVGVALPEAVNR